MFCSAMRYGTVLLALTGSAFADLTCITWDVLTPVMGKVCAYKPDPYGKGSELPVDAIEDSANDLKQLGKFTVTHSTANLTYAALDTATKAGLQTAPSAGSQGMAKLVDDVTIGFGDVARNQAVTLLEWSVWEALWSCVFDGAIEYARNTTGFTTVNSTDDGTASSTTSLAKPLTSDVANKVVLSCAGKGFHELMSPLIFKNVTDPKGKATATISTIAGLLVPVGAETRVGEAPAQEPQGLDLVIAGIEDTTRIVKWLSGNNGSMSSGPFTNLTEALSVKNALKGDLRWQDTNCAVCNAPVASGRKRSSKFRLMPRGGAFSMCCYPPKEAPWTTPPSSDAGSSNNGASSSSSEVDIIKETVPDSISTDVIELSEESLDDSSDSEDVVAPIYISVGGTAFGEKELKPPPDFPIRDFATDGPTAIAQDVHDRATGVVKWPTEMTDVMDSTAFFKKIRQIASNGPRDKMWRKLRFNQKDTSRINSISDKWLEVDDADLKPYQDFAKAAIDFAVDVTSKTLGKDPGKLKGFMEIFYTGTGGGVPRTVVLGGHIDDGYLVFGSADQPGLVIAHGDTRPPDMSRIIPQPNTFQLMAANRYPGSMWNKVWWARGTYHAVYGPEISQFGRASMIVTVNKVPKPDEE